MKPLARFIDKIEKNKRKKFEDEVSKMSIDEVVKRTAKLIIEDLIRYNGRPVDIVIADRGSCEDNSETILEYMSRKKDKKLKAYVYMIKGDRLERNRTITNLVAKELEKQGCKVEFVSHKQNYSYRAFMDYEVTMYVCL